MARRNGGRRRRGAGTAWLAWLGLLLFALFLVRLLGPGGGALRAFIAGAPTGGDGAVPPADARPSAGPSPDATGATVPGDGDRGGDGVAAGTVRFPDDAPAAGATVAARFFHADGRPVEPPEVVVGADGSFRMTGVPAGWGEARFEVRRGPLRGEAVLRPEAASADGSVRVDLLLSDRFNVGGVVVSAEEGRPLPGIAVVLGERRTTTDARGRFRFDALPRDLVGAGLPPLLVSGEGRAEERIALDAARPVDDLLVRLPPSGGGASADGAADR